MTQIVDEVMTRLKAASCSSDICITITEQHAYRNLSAKGQIDHPEAVRNELSQIGMKVLVSSNLLFLARPHLRVSGFRDESRVLSLPRFFRTVNCNIPLLREQVERMNITDTNYFLDEQPTFRSKWIDIYHILGMQF